MTDHAHEEQFATEFCEKHPEREASLRCNRCNRLMCSKCAVHTPTGYRCEDCVRGQQKAFDTAEPRDYILGPIVAGFLSLIIVLILGNFGFFFLLIGAAFAGSLIAEATRRTVSRRRSKTLFKVITLAVFLSGLLPALFPFAAFVWGLLISGQGLGTAILMAVTTLGYTLPWNFIYAIVISASTYYSLAGLRI